MNLPSDNGLRATDYGLRLNPDAEHGLFEARDHARADVLELALGAAAGRVLVAAAAERLRDARDVDLVLRPQADAPRLVVELLEERNRFDLADRQRVVDDAVGVL